MKFLFLMICWKRRKNGEQHLVEAVAEYDDKLLEKFFEDPDSITEDEMHEAIRKATIDMTIIPMMCGSSFKNKGVQTALMQLCVICRSNGY